MRRTLSLLLLCALAKAGLAQDTVPAHPHIRLETTEGTIVLELDGRRAPLTVANFLGLVDSGYYDGTIFHRVIPGFMIQGGGYTSDLKEKESGDPIPNESGNGLANIRGTIAMARTSDPHSAQAQFFINVNDNDSLNPQADRWGYAVFGYVIEGMDVADKIVNVRTGPAGQFSRDVPVSPIVLTKASRVSYDD
ncbi:MAG: peptidylprolyl isomerase [Woeseiaceae bacterium]|nr:peptidylprolyl isomerase [Woeseiaceae bacterium]